MMSFNLKTKTNNLINWFLDTLFPKYCLSCSKEGFYVCPDCFVKIPIQKSFFCYICARRSPDGKTCKDCKSKTGSILAGLLIASDWNNLFVRQIIYECKYRFIKDLSSPLADLLIIFLNQSGFFIQRPNINIESYILVPVPLHKRRLSWRGFNQAELIANRLGHYLKFPVLNNALIRNRHTPPQMDIKDKQERIKNVSSAFALNNEIDDAEKLKGKIVILIDDVCTTGSTLEECAKVLKLLRPKEIWGLVVARG